VSNSVVVRWRHCACKSACLNVC